MRSPWLVLMLLPAVFAASGELLVSVAKAFMGARHLSVMTAFVCRHSDEVRVAKRLMGLGMRIAVFSDQEKEGLLRTSLSINYQSMAVVIDMSCAGAQALLQQDASGICAPLGLSKRERVLRRGHRDAAARRGRPSGGRHLHASGAPGRGRFRGHYQPLQWKVRVPAAIVGRDGTDLQPSLQHQRLVHHPSGVGSADGRNPADTQGSCFDSPRTVYLTLLVLSVSLYTVYSAIIVTLLQAPGPPIRTLTDLMASPLQLCMQDLISNTKYVNETIDPEVKRLFREKLYPQPPEVAFTTPEKGLAKVKEGLVAFHGDMASGFKINSDTFEESAKCRLRYVQMITSVKITIPVKKGMMWVREAGLLKREDLLWVSQAPKCSGDGPGFVVIGFAEVSPILEVFIYGSFLAGTFFVLEMAFRRLCQRSD
ncbi:hypothetical protein C0J52_10731 [Blattella germanica]|nr:hypothetical protein C0J52_10731 [Blattella germanica]